MTARRPPLPLLSQPQPPHPRLSPCLLCWKRQLLCMRSLLLPHLMCHWPSRSQVLSCLSPRLRRLRAASRPRRWPRCRTGRATRCRPSSPHRTSSQRQCPLPHPRLHLPPQPQPSRPPLSLLISPCIPLQRRLRIRPALQSVCCSHCTRLGRCRHCLSPLLTRRCITSSDCSLLSVTASDKASCCCCTSSCPTRSAALSPGSSLQTALLCPLHAQERRWW